MSVRHLFAAWVAADRGDPPDRDLIDRFRRTRDDAAFAQLVRRHGPMVWGVCRRVVGDTHAAEDAFQATFLVLVLRADDAVGVRELGGWLHGVAVRTATKARSRHRRTLDRERPTDPVPHPPTADAPANDWLPLLDEELARLADKYRQPLLLCDVHGLTLREAAMRLGVPVGTLSERLGKARQSLAARLARRGVVPAVGFTLAATDPPLSLAAATVERAVLVACGGAETLPILGLSKGVVRAMWWSKVKATAAAVVIAAGAGTAVVGGWLTAAPPDKPAAARTEPVTVNEFVTVTNASANGWVKGRTMLTGRPPAEVAAVLTAAWDRVPNADARREMTRNFGSLLASGPDAAPTLDVLDKAMRDRAAEVRNQALYDLRGYALRDFSTDFTAYEAWYKASRPKTFAALAADTAKQFAATARKADLIPLDHVFGQFVRAYGEAGLRAAADAKLVERFAAMAVTPDKAMTAETDRKASELALREIGELKPTEAQLKALLLPLAEDTTRPWRQEAAGRALRHSLGGRKFDWLRDYFRREMVAYPTRDPNGTFGISLNAAEALADMDDAASIPAMIAVIDADNTYDTVYWIGHFALGKLTGVAYDDKHDGKWWRSWWAKNNAKFPAEVRAIPIPNLPKMAKAVPADDDPLADVKDVPAVEKTVGGDARRRYIVVGKTADAPAGGRKLLVVLPGGDGSAEFNPFLRRVWKNALGTDWVLVQAVAPAWVVWPTEKLANKPFTVEPFLEGIVDEMTKAGGIDANHVYLLGWSSGGPACYATLLRNDSPFRGAFVAMSVFQPDVLPPLEMAKGKPVYLLQSPDDRVTPFRFAEAAEKKLSAAGATVTLVKYDGGHGWHGDPFEMIAAGAKWLVAAKR